MSSATQSIHKVVAEVDSGTPETTRISRRQLLAGQAGLSLGLALPACALTRTSEIPTSSENSPLSPAWQTIPEDQRLEWYQQGQWRDLSQKPATSDEDRDRAARLRADLARRWWVYPYDANTNGAMTPDRFTAWAKPHLPANQKAALIDMIERLPASDVAGLCAIARLFDAHPAGTGQGGAA